MKVGDLVITASLGEIKAYKAEPRTLEAEAGLKPSEIKLDLISAIDIVEAHKRIQDLLSDEPGQFNKATLGDSHNLKKEILSTIIKTVAEDIDKLIEQYGEKKVFLSVPQEHANAILSEMKNEAKLFRIVKKDLLKTDKNKLIEEFKPELLK